MFKYEYINLFYIIKYAFIIFILLMILIMYYINDILTHI